MRWVTRAQIRVNRTATAWLVRRFVDPEATFRFADPGEVAAIQGADQAIGFDAPGARYPHQDSRGRCSFEMLVDQCCPTDPALGYLAQVVHFADFPGERPATGPEALDILSLARRRDIIFAARLAAGLRAISRGFPLVAADDYETLERSAFLYDALYASIRAELAR